MQDEKARLGYAYNIITPKQDMELQGYVPTRMSQGKHDDLRVKAVSIALNGKYYAWMVTDLLGNTRFLKECIQEDLKKKGIVFEDIQLFSTHTHSGPIVLDKKEYEAKDHLDIERQYFDFLLTQASGALSKSLEDLKPFTYRLAIGQMSQFQSNRINPSYPYDADILAIEIDRGEDKGLIYSFGGHPTILNPSSHLYSTDFVGAVDRNLEKDYAFTNFFNAACGDMSTRFYRQESSLDEVQRLGLVAANCVKETLKNLGESQVLTHYQVEDIHVDLKLKDFDSPKKAQEKLDEAQKELETLQEKGASANTLRLAQSRLEGAQTNAGLVRSYLSMKTIDYKVSLISVDTYCVISLSSEVFSELALSLKQDNKTWILTLADQYRSYLVNKRAFDEGTYESLASIYAYGEGERLMEIIKEKRKSS